MFELTGLTVEELKQGYRATGEGYTCSACGATFDADEVFPVGGRLLTAERAAKAHVRTEHGGSLPLLTDPSNKYVTLTDTQRTLMNLAAEGLSDKEIAQRMNVTPSTVRHQKFVFREKAKQARLYLAAYETAFSGDADVAPIHDGANMVDDRYVMTEAEREKILSDAFSSRSPLRLKFFPVKEKKKVAILTEIAECFTRGKNYTEKEVNGILKEIYPDYATLRRYLIEYGFLDRTPDCNSYWVK